MASTRDFQCVTLQNNWWGKLGSLWASVSYMRNHVGQISVPCAQSRTYDVLTIVHFENSRANKIILIFQNFQNIRAFSVHSVACTVICGTQVYISTKYVSISHKLAETAENSGFSQKKNKSLFSVQNTKQ